MLIAHIFIGRYIKSTMQKKEHSIFNQIRELYNSI